MYKKEFACIKNGLYTCIEKDIITITNQKGLKIFLQKNSTDKEIIAAIKSFFHTTDVYDLNDWKRV